MFATELEPHYSSTQVYNLPWAIHAMYGHVNCYQCPDTFDR